MDVYRGKELGTEGLMWTLLPKKGVEAVTMTKVSHDQSQREA